MEIPYTEDQLKEALGEIKEEIMTEENRGKIINIINANLTETNNERIKKIAEMIGITTLDLINSTNYQTIIDDDRNKRFSTCVSELVAEIGLTIPQAYGVVFYSAGKLTL